MMKNKINQLSFFEETKLSNHLFKKFEEIHNYIYANEGLSEQQVLEEIIKILFIKFYDEQKNSDRFYISKTDFLNINSKKTGVAPIFGYLICVDLIYSTGDFMPSAEWGALWL